jgi:hypothetical protein
VVRVEEAAEEVPTMPVQTMLLPLRLLLAWKRWERWKGKRWKGKGWRGKGQI